jgi:hypothetical protein
MSFYRSSDLARHSDSELATLFRTVAQVLPRTASGSPEQRDALAMLENIRRELASRRIGPKP